MDKAIMDRLANVPRIRVNIFKLNGSSCANGGPSDNPEINSAMLCDSDDIEALLALQNTLNTTSLTPCPVLRVVRRRLHGWGKNGSDYDYVHAEPIRGHLRETGFMCGGSFVYSSDSRYEAITGLPYAIKLHDRQEA